MVSGLLALVRRPRRGDKALPLTLTINLERTCEIAPSKQGSRAELGHGGGEYQTPGAVDRGPTCGWITRPPQHSRRFLALSRQIRPSEKPQDGRLGGRQGLVSLSY